MISEIKDMLNSPSTKNFNSLNLENLDLLDYKDLILTTLNNLEKANYPLNQINLIQVLITAIIEVKKKSEEKSELELIHYDIVLTWLSKIQTEESFDMIVGQKIVSFLIEKISVKTIKFLQ